MWYSLNILEKIYLEYILKKIIIINYEFNEVSESTTRILGSGNLVLPLAAGANVIKPSASYKFWY
jgi:hypothetical protein